MNSLTPIGVPLTPLAHTRPPAARTAPQTPPARPISDARAIANAHPQTKIADPTLTGPWHIDVGARSYAIPEGSSIAHHADEAIEYVLTPAGGLHVLTERGELTGIAPAILADLRRTRFQT